MIGRRAVAELLGVHPGTVLALVRAGRIPAYQVGQQLRFRPEDVDAYIAAARIPTQDAS